MANGIPTFCFGGGMPPTFFGWFAGLHIRIFSGYLRYDTIDVLFGLFN